MSEFRRGPGKKGEPVYLALCDTHGCEPVRRFNDQRSRDTWADNHERRLQHRVWLRAEDDGQQAIYPGMYTAMIRRQEPHDPLVPEPGPRR